MLRQVQSLPRFRLGRTATWLSRKYTTNSGAQALKITEDSDFAFRKDHVEGLTAVEQDRQYYPRLRDAIRELADDATHIKMLRVPEFRSLYRDVTPENIKEFENDSRYLLCGKITSIRRAGKGSMFIDIRQDFDRVQLIVHHKVMDIDKEQFLDLHSAFRPGDQVIAFGNVGVTKVGELSLKLVKPLKLAAPSLHPLPPRFNDVGKINQNRVVDYLVNRDSVEVILLRSRVIQLIRQFLEERQFISVETPIICNGNSGANATPFETSSQHIENWKDGENAKLNLRVAPELWLKKLIIAGFDKVYEIGKSFRNEGIDATHNPEFTTCEFYQTFIGLSELMEMGEEMIIFILNKILQESRFERFHETARELYDKIQSNGGKFRRLEFLDTLAQETGEYLANKDLNREGLVRYYNKIGLSRPDINSMNASELINELSERFVEPQCSGKASQDGGVPTFIYNIPEISSPLSKSDSSSGISYRFEMYIDGREYMNAYEEENNPFKQRSKFSQQMENRLAGDNESLLPDERFVEFMEWGMPPTGGFGLGIDRLVMRLAGQARIERVLSFGRITDVIKQ